MRSVAGTSWPGRRFSIGYPPLLPIRDWEAVLDRFADCLHDVYTSPPGEAALHSRREIAAHLSGDSRSRDRFYRSMELVAERGVGINLALNTAALETTRARAALEEVRARLPVATVVTLAEIGAALKRDEPGLDLVYSYNNGVRDITGLPRDNRTFSTIVFGGKHLRDFALFEEARRRGLAVKLLLNNGCSFNCPGACFRNRTGSSCEDVAIGNVETCGIDFLYAVQSLMPFELHEHFPGGAVDLYKLSTRTVRSRSELEFMLDSYLRNINEPRSPQDLTAWARLFVFHRMCGEIDLGAVLEIKRRLWERGGRVGMPGVSARPASPASPRTARRPPRGGAPRA